MNTMDASFPSSSKRSSRAVKHLPPDVIFAQKATAIVKAAGMDPRSVDLERFRTSACIIFTRAYCAIFKEDLLATLKESSSKEDKVLNVQLVVDGLMKKTKNPILEQVSGIDVFNGSHKAIGILVGVLFAEGQRMWLEKVKSVQEDFDEQQQHQHHNDDAYINDRQQSSAAADSDNADHVNLSGISADDSQLHSLNNNNNSSSSSSNSKGDADVVAVATAAATHNTLRMLQALKANPQMTSKDLERLLRRELTAAAATTADDGDVGAAAVDKVGSRKRKKKKSLHQQQHQRRHRIVGKRITEAILHSSDYHRSNGSSNKRSVEDQEAQELQEADDFIRDDDGFNLSGDSMDESSDYRLSHSEQQRRHRHRLHNQQQQQQQQQNGAMTRHRPSSAPHSRRVNRPSRRQQQQLVSERLYSAALARPATASEVSSSVKQQLQLQLQQQQQQQQPMNDPSQYTYDWRTGRKIPLSDARLEYEERRRKREAMGRIIALSDMEVDGVVISPRAADTAVSQSAAVNAAAAAAEWPPSPTRAEYPNKSIGGDVRKWLQKMRRERYVAPAPPSPRKASAAADATAAVDLEQLPAAKYFAAYQKLECNDLIISIEHCCRCESHNVTTRHKERDYLDNSLLFLRQLAQLAYDCGVCARVGVTRFPAHVTKHSKITDCDSRIGAFEIQAAFRQPDGRVVPELLHSKLLLRRWPSKRVLEKRFRVFLAKAQVPMIPASLAVHSSAAAAPEFAADSAEAYPVGVCKWSDSPLANAGWSFALTERKLSMPITDVTTATAATTGGGSGSKFARAIEAAQAAATTATAATDGAVPPVPQLPPPPAAAAAKTSIGAQLLNVQWAFDTREVTAPPPSFEVGNSVRVSFLEFAAGCVERHALLAVVKGYATNSSSNSGSGGSVDAAATHESDLFVKLKYLQQEVRVLQDCCCSIAEYEPRDVIYSSSEVPVELECLLLLRMLRGPHDQSTAATTGKSPRSYNNTNNNGNNNGNNNRNNSSSNGWEVVAGEDRIDAVTGEVLLSRSSFFNQVRALSWSMEQQLRVEGKSVNELPLHPATDAAVDIQLSYSEEVIDWAAEKYKGVVNVTAIEKMVAAKNEHVLTARAAAADAATVVTVATAVTAASDATGRSALTPALADADTNSTAAATADSVLPVAAVTNVDATVAAGVSATIEASVTQIEVADAESASAVTSAASIDAAAAAVKIDSSQQKTADSQAVDSPIETTAIASSNVSEAAAVLVAAAAEPIASISAAADAANEKAQLNSAEAAAELAAGGPGEAAMSAANTPTTAAVASDDATGVKASIEVVTDEATTVAVSAEGTAPTADSTTVEAASDAVAATATAVAATTAVADPVVEPTAEEKEEQFKNSLTYQPKDMEFVSLIIEGEQLRHPHFDSVMLQVHVAGHVFEASACLAREKGSKRRSYHPKWNEFPLSSDVLRSEFVHFTLLVADAAVAESNPQLPTIANTQLGQSPNSVKVPLYKLMKSTFDCKVEAHLPAVISGKSTAVAISFLGHAREAKFQRAERIMSMKPEELVNMRFDNILHLDDDEDEHLYSDDSDMEAEDDNAAAASGVSTSAGAAGSTSASPSKRFAGRPRSYDKSDAADLKRQLYPQASLKDLYSTSNDSSNATAAAAEP